MSPTVAFFQPPALRLSSDGLTPFPWGMYLSGQEWTDATSFAALLSTLQGLGFTHLVLGGGVTDEELALCDAAGVFVFQIVSGSFTAGDTAEEIVSARVGHPSICYWSARDEPSTAAHIATDVSRVAGLHHVSYKRAGDTFGVYVGGNIPAQQAFAQSLNPGILVIDNYPLNTANATGNLTRSGFTSDFATTQQMMLIDPATGRDWCKPDVPYWSILQGHGSPTLRAPSLAEITRMAWEALGTGTNGMFWFIWAYTDANSFVYDGISAHADRQATLQTLIGRISPFGDLFATTRPQPCPTYATGQGWAYSLHAASGEDILVVVNRDVAGSRSISIASGGPYTDMETDEVVTAGTAFDLAAGDARLFTYTQPDLTSGKLVWDTFTGADNTTLPNHTPELGGPWTDLAGTSGILQGRATKLITADTLSAIDPGVMNTSISADLAYAGSGQSHICLRVQDINNHVRAGFIDNKLGLVKKVGGTVTTLFHDTVVRNTGEPQRITLTQNGNVFTMYRNGVLLTTQTITDLSTRTKAGLFFTSTFDARVDNLAITSP